jgi:hypothetical protein
MKKVILLAVATLCTLALLLPGGRSTPEAAGTGKIQLAFDIVLPDPDYAEGYPANRTLGGVKEKVLRTLLNDLQHNLDQFRTFKSSEDPMTPPTLLDEGLTLAELGLADGTVIIIMQ